MSRLVRSPNNFEEDDIPNKEMITNLGNFVFSGSTYHKFVGWKNLLKLDGVTFHANNNLEIVNLSLTKVESLEESCFFICPNLKTVILPSFLNSITTFGFNQVDKLVAISIPATVNVLDESCFYEMKGLKVVCYYGNVSFS